MVKRIPLIDPQEAERSPADKTRFIDTLERGFEDIGFVFVRMDGISSILLPIYSKFRQVFRLPFEVKQKYAKQEYGYQVGWTPLYGELGIACRRIGEGGAPMRDYKECWFIRQDPWSDREEMIEKFPLSFPPISNIWPVEVQGFSHAMWKLYLTLLTFAKKTILPALDIYLGKPECFFNDMIESGPTSMRSIYYPNVLPELAGKVIWGCNHTDINLITVLPPSLDPPSSPEAGLWIRRRDGEWIRGSAPDECVIFQVGDMLDYLTGGWFMSAAHEVRAPEISTKQDRVSAALFIHPHPATVLDPGMPKFPARTAYSMLEERLRQIDLASG
ncbi:MAG: isopenicillin N synthase family oxygenase [Candidatus Yanofskybacteria bacterium]|nr:isopenicillin N synthase family oxygenase [Candidatus Yanofskybacteria bacterium]